MKHANILQHSTQFVNLNCINEIRSRISIWNSAIYHRQLSCGCHSLLHHRYGILNGRVGIFHMRTMRVSCVHNYIWSMFAAVVAPNAKPENLCPTSSNTTPPKTCVALITRNTVVHNISNGLCVITMHTHIFPCAVTRLGIWIDRIGIDNNLNQHKYAYILFFGRVGEGWRS